MLVHTFGILAGLLLVERAFCSDLYRGGLSRYAYGYDGLDDTIRFIDSTGEDEKSDLDELYHNYHHEEAKETNSIEDDSTLVLTHVIFRHGDRTPDTSTIYPTDPYANETYYPFGKGQLVPAGRERAHRVGKALRARYNRFLGATYYPDLLEARSSSYPRTQMTLQLVLAGLFPPTKETQVSSLNWIPVPYTFKDQSVDDLIATYVSCEKVFDMVDNLEKTPKYQQELAQYRRLFTYLSEFSGWNVNSTRLLFFIQNTLKTESEWGFQLPQWTSKVWQKPLETAAVKFWKFLSSTPELRRITIGNLLKKIISDSMRKVEGTLAPKGRKIYLYSGHDFNVFPMLTALGVKEEVLTPYSAYILIELHKVDGVYGFKVYYQDYAKVHPRLIQLPNCDKFCPFDQFVEIVKENIPGDKWC